MDLVVYDDRDQRYVPLLVSLVFALLVATLVGAVAFFVAGRSAEPAEPLSGVSAPRAAVQDEPSACGPAIERAEAALEIAARLERALGAQTSLVDELLAQRLTREQVLDRALPPLTAAAKDRQAFLDATTAYEQARAACRQ